MALRGDTSNLLLADIFQTLSQNGQMGLLTLRSADQRRRVLFSQRGITAYDAKVFHATRLAHLLVAGGVVERTQVEAAMHEVDKSGPDPFSSIPLLVLLEEQELLNIQQGVEILRNEVREELFEVFTLSRMEFEFDDSEVPVEGIPQQCFYRTEEVVLEAARRLDEGELINKRLGKVQEFFVAEAGGAIPAADPRVLELLDGSYTVTDIAERLLMSRFEVSRTVWRLLEDERLRPATADELIQAARRLDPATQSARVTRILQRARVRLKPSDARLDDIGDLLIRAGANSAAIAVLLVRARSLLAEGNQETAYSQVVRARDLDANNLGVLQTLAEIYQARGEKEAETKVLTSLAERCAAAEKYDEAVDHATQVARLNPDSPLLDRAFASYCQKAGLEKHGADVLSEAAGLRSSASRVAVLYDAILLLDPGRGDIRKAKARQRKSRSHLRMVWIGCGLLLIPMALLCGSYVIGRMAEERLVGRLQGAKLLLDKGEATLAEAELQAMLAEVPDGELKDELGGLLAQAQERLAETRQKEQTERDQTIHGELAQVQTDIEARRYAEAVARLARIEADTGGDNTVSRQLNARLQILEQMLGEERAALARLSRRFAVPDNDSDLISVHGEFAGPFSSQRHDAFVALRGELASLPAGSKLFSSHTGLTGLTDEALAAFAVVRPGLEAMESRITRNQQLDLLSEDYQEIRDAEASGDFGAAIRGYDRLLRMYGNGPLRSMFEKRRTAASEVLKALDEVRSLVDHGDVIAANDRARRAAEDARDLGLGRTVGYPIQVKTLPAGASLEANGRSLGTAPCVYWVKEEKPAVITAMAPGFRSVDVTVTIASEPEVLIELRRLGQFQVDLDTPIDVSPTVSGGSLFVGARDGVLYRLDLRDGSRLGEHTTGSLGGIAAPPLRFDRWIILALGEGEIRAVDRDSLATRWSLPHGCPLAGPPELIGDVLLVATVDGRLYEIDARRGRERLVAAVEGPVRSGPAVIGSLAALGLTNGSVVGLSRENGAIRFSTPERPHPVIGIAASGKLFIAALDSGVLLALAARDGSVAWERVTGLSAAAPPSANDGLLVFAAGHRAFVLDGENGEVRLEADAGEWIAGTPSLAGGRLYVGDRTGTLSVFDVSTGTLLFRNPLRGQLRAAPLVVQEGVLVVSDAGILALLGT